MRWQRKLQERRGTQILTDASAVLQILAGGGWPLPDARQGGLQPVQHAATHRPGPALYCESSPYIYAPVKSALSCACMHSLPYMAQCLVYKIRMLMCGVHLKPLNCPEWLNGTDIRYKLCVDWICDLLLMCASEHVEWCYLIVSLSFQARVKPFYTGGYQVR